MIILYTIDVRKFLDKKIFNDTYNSASNFRKEKYDVLKNDLVRLQSIAATYLLKQGLKKYDIDEKNIEYRLGKAGKPYFKNHEEIFFNISHSQNISMVAFSDREVGCDIQVVKNNSSELYDLTLSESEKKKLLNINNLTLRNEEFFKFWAIKEAIIKRDGTGLMNSLTDVFDSYGYIEKKIIIADNEIYYICVNNGIVDKVDMISL